MFSVACYIRPLADCESQFHIYSIIFALILSRSLSDWLNQFLWSLHFQISSIPLVPLYTTRHIAQARIRSLPSALSLSLPFWLGCGPRHWIALNPLPKHRTVSQLIWLMSPDCLSAETANRTDEQTDRQAGTNSGNRSPEMGEMCPIYSSLPHSLPSRFATHTHTHTADAYFSPLNVHFLFFRTLTQYRQMLQYKRVFQCKICVFYIV